jgi:uncharacterized protein
MKPHPSLAHTAHRPWPLPGRPWQWRQSWSDLLFAHWTIPPGALAAHIPTPLTLDTRDGQAWLGLVPFRMSGVARRPLPPVPGTSAFPELNVRTYVRYEDKPGVFFFSLDASNRLAVWAARTFFHLPYRNATMSCQPDGDAISYSSLRRPGEPAGAGEPASPARFKARYGATAPGSPASADSLEEWLAERYCLYTLDPKGTLWRGQIHHAQWHLQPAFAEIETNLLDPFPITPGQPPDHLAFSRNIEVALWPFEQA